MGHAAGKSGNLVQTRDHEVAAAAELGQHAVHRALVASHRLNARHLREAGGAGVGIGHQPGDVGCQVSPHDSIAHAPARHSVGLGKSIEQNGALLEAIHCHDGKMAALEDQTAVDLIAQHNEVAIADDARDFAHVALAQDAAGGIVRRIQNDEFGAVVDQAG